MAKIFYLSLIMLSGLAQAQIFQLPFGDKSEGAPAPALERSLADLDKLEITSSFEEKYRALTIEIERQFDLKRGECAENTTKADKQRCFRDVITAQKRFLERSFELKKEYLKKLQEQQMAALDEAKQKALNELERQF